MISIIPRRLHRPASGVCRVVHPSLASRVCCFSRGNNGHREKDGKKTPTRDADERQTKEGKEGKKKCNQRERWAASPRTLKERGLRKKKAKGSFASEGRKGERRHQTRIKGSTKIISWNGTGKFVHPEMEPPGCVTLPSNSQPQTSLSLSLSLSTFPFFSFCSTYTVFLPFLRVAGSSCSPVCRVFHVASE